MRWHGAALTAVVLALLVAGFSTGSPMFLALAVLALLVMALGLAAVLIAAKTLEVQASVAQKRVQRGDEVDVEIAVRHACPLPIAPVELTLQAGPDTPETVLHLMDAGRRGQKAVLRFHAEHVGASRPGVKRCRVEDVFGLFTVTWPPRVGGDELLVLPRAFDVEKMTFAPGDAGLGTMARATEDLTSPSDVRAYTPGDAMKKIHWKLSLRKRELLVRRFEEPVLPDALVLLDCARPQAERAEEEADLRDALLETAASVMSSLEKDDHAARLPLMGAHPTQLDKGMGMPLILENLARADFSETDRFERMMTMESRNLARVGAVAIITSRLSGDLVEAVSAVRRRGPTVRLYLVTFHPEDERLLPYISRLQRSRVEVGYVTPMRM